MTSLFSLRLASLGGFVKSKGIRKCEEILRTGSTAEVKELLMPINGIGPKVLANFHLLRGSK
jgi:hypothetical protein